MVDLKQGTARIKETFPKYIASDHLRKNINIFQLAAEKYKNYDDPSPQYLPRLWW